MRSFYIVLLLIIFGSPAIASEDSLVVHLKSGKQIAIAVTALERLSFDSIFKNLSVYHGDDSWVSYSPLSGKINCDFERQVVIRVSLADNAGRTLSRSLFSLQAGKSEISIAPLQRAVKCRQLWCIVEGDGRTAVFPIIIP